jgi:hypothetical protein
MTVATRTGLVLDLEASASKTVDNQKLVSEPEM